MHAHPLPLYRGIYEAPCIGEGATGSAECKRELADTRPQAGNVQVQDFVAPARMDKVDHAVRDSACTGSIRPKVPSHLVTSAVVEGNPTKWSMEVTTRGRHWA